MVWPLKGQDLNLPFSQIIRKKCLIFINFIQLIAKSQKNLKGPRKLQNLNHPNLVKLIGLVKDHLKSNKSLLVPQLTHFKGLNKHQKKSPKFLPCSLKNFKLKWSTTVKRDNLKNFLKQKSNLKNNSVRKENNFSYHEFKVPGLWLIVFNKETNSELKNFNNLENSSASMKKSLII